MSFRREFLGMDLRFCGIAFDCGINFVSYHCEKLITIMVKKLNKYKKVLISFTYAIHSDVVPNLRTTNLKYFYLYINTASYIEKEQEVKIKEEIFF